MGNKSKQDQSVQRQTNDYEKTRLLRVQENKKILLDLGVKGIVKSLTSLVESQKTKKKRVKPTCTNTRDGGYIPNMSDDSEGDYHEVATSVDAFSKQHHPQYIAPLSMNKLASLAKKHRVIAPKVSHNFATDSNASKDNQSRAKVTMGELISSKKGSQRQSVVYKQNIAKPNCITHGAKRQLLLLDEDDEEDHDIFQDINGVDREPNGSKDNENEDEIVRSEDDEYENMDQIAIANNENEIYGDDSNDDLENENDILAQEQLGGPELEKAIGFSKLKKRGPTMMHDVDTRKVNEREVIICNEFGQPVRPIEKDVVGQFSRFLGTIAHNHSYAPLIHNSWHKVPHKDKMWEYVLEKYDVPDAAKTWVLKTIGHIYKVYKCRFKKKHFYQYKDNKTRWKNRPKSIPQNDFLQLLSMWNDKNVTKNEDPNKELPTLTQLFKRTRKRTEGRSYVDTYDDTARKIEQMKNYKPLEDESASIDPYRVVMNKEHDEYCRLYGKDVTNKLLKKVDGGDTSYMIPRDLMESFKASVEVEKTS